MNRAKLADRYQQDGLATIPPSQLVVRLYERLQRDLEQARTAAQEGRVEAAHLLLVHAQDIVFELNVALDLEIWPEGAALAELYRYLTNRLVEANLRKSPDIIADCSDHVRPLVEAWQSALVISQRERASVATASPMAAAASTPAVSAAGLGRTYTA